MNKSAYFILMCLFSSFASASDSQTLSVDSAIHRGLEFLKQDQHAVNTGHYVAGEWRVEMKSYLIPSLVGLGRHLARPSQEPTAFATASVMNLLSEAYLVDQTLTDVPQMLRNGISSFEGYREGGVFFYYPMTEFKGMRLHVPRDPHYVPRSMMSLALVPPDADTTSVGFTSLAFADKILNNKPVSSFKISEETLSTLERFRDNERAPHPYNRLNGGVKNSGAYLTWLWDENAESSSFFKSMNDSPKKGYRIVFGRNDVDCVVNANVLRLFSLTNNKDQAGFANSCEFLNQSIIQSRNLDTQAKYCGLYYPNTFGAIYSISNAYKAGASCLDKSRNPAVKLILSRQNENGSWSNDFGIGREDRVQSTASALGALLNYASPGDRQYVEVVRRGVQFLVSQAIKKDDSRHYWVGEVFFSAGPAARNTILWRSDAYTTALVISTLVKAKAYINGEVTR